MTNSAAARVAEAKAHVHDFINNCLVSNSGPAREIREFTHKAMDLAPRYFFTRKASTTGKYHRGETLVEHTQAALTIGRHIVSMMREGFWGPIWDDAKVACFYSAVILHDIFASGVPGQERRDFKSKELRTDPFHMMYPEFYLRTIKVAGKPAWKHDWYSEITGAIAYHYGPWSPLATFDPRELKFSDLRISVFLADYFSSREDIGVRISP